MARIPMVLQEHINTAFPDNVTLVGTALPDGYARLSPDGRLPCLAQRAAARPRLSICCPASTTLPRGAC